MKESYYFFWVIVGIYMDIDKYVVFDAFGCFFKNYYFNDVGSWNYRCFFFIFVFLKLYILNFIFLIYFYCDIYSSVYILIKLW